MSPTFLLCTARVKWPTLQGEHTPEPAVLADSNSFDWAENLTLEQSTDEINEVQNKIGPLDTGRDQRKATDDSNQNVSL